MHTHSLTHTTDCLILPAEVINAHNEVHEPWKQVAAVRVLGFCEGRDAPLKACEAYVVMSFVK